jgi:cytidylate kinase
MPERVIEKLIQRQLNQWNRMRELLPEIEPAELPRRPIITISRQVGSGGRELAEALARRLDLQVHDQDIVEHIARNEKIAAEVVAHLDEQTVSQIDLWVRGVLNRRIYMRDEYQEELVRTVRTLAAHGGVVVLGRGGTFILADRADLRLRLVAPVETRVQALVNERGLSVAEAEQSVAESDAARADFVRKLFRADIDDPVHYDLVINTDGIDGDRLPELVLLALEVRGAFEKREP